MTCKYCNGTGRILVEPGSSPWYRCTDCDGTGIVRYPDEDSDDYDTLLARDAAHNAAEISGFE